MIFEQRYADISSAGSRKAAAKWAETGGFIIALVNYRGTHESEGVYRGYRGNAMGTAEGRLRSLRVVWHAAVDTVKLALMEDRRLVMRRTIWQSHSRRTWSPNT